ncbi:sperm microtubule associated protein 2-like [Heterodontus francisci]|uniref:sperm microtubule associated protein 2-like n=1 Tax=Heterodontus francisci TaxID=7792 RepID=UPI00355BD255
MSTSDDPLAFLFVNGMARDGQPFNVKSGSLHGDMVGCIICTDKDPTVNILLGQYYANRLHLWNNLRGKAVMILTVRPAMWPVKTDAMKAKPTPRTQELAKPKPIRKDNNSIQAIYAKDKSKAADGEHPTGKTSKTNKEYIIYAETPRFVYLSEPKKLSEGFASNRLSPIWPVSPKTMKARPSSRIRELAKPKQPHKDWQPGRSVYSAVRINEDILTATSSDRTDQLAQHKAHIDPPVRTSYLWDYPYWDPEISEGAKTISPSNRILELAKPKGNYEGYVPSRPLEQPVSESSLNYTATERIQELAKPKVRTVVTKSEDPFEISAAAKNAVATPRLEQLAVPIPRKVTRKKFG